MLDKLEKWKSSWLSIGAFAKVNEAVSYAR